MHVNITSAGKQPSILKQLKFYLIFNSAGIIALLSEDDDRLKITALKQLNKLVDIFWAEIADSITTM